MDHKLFNLTLSSSREELLSLLNGGGCFEIRAFLPASSYPAVLVDFGKRRVRVIGRKFLDRRDPANPNPGLPSRGLHSDEALPVLYGETTRGEFVAYIERSHKPTAVEAINAFTKVSPISEHDCEMAAMLEAGGFKGTIDEILAKMPDKRRTGGITEPDH